MAYFGNAVYPLPLVNPADIVTITTSTALSEASYGKTFVLTAAGALTITLTPLLAASTTRKVTLINDSVAGVTTINASGSDRIRALGVSVASFTLSPGDVIILQNNGATWSIADNSSWKANAAGSSTQVFSALAGTGGSNVTTVAQLQSGSVYTVAAGGTSDALTATFTPAITALANQTLLVRALLANQTGAPTFSPNGMAAVAIVKGAGVPLNSGDISGPGHWLELTGDIALGKWVLQNPATGVQVPYVAKRNTVSSGPTDMNGYAANIGVGTGLAPVLQGGTVPVTLTFSSGFGASGAVDNFASVNSNSAWPALPANNLNFLSVDRNAVTGALTQTSSKAQPQFGPVFDQTKQSVLQFGGAALSTTFLDDFGTAWTAVSGARVQTNQFKFGAGALGGSGTNNVLNGTSDYLRNTSLTTLGTGSWSLRTWYYPTSLAANPSGLIGAVNAGGYGLILGVTNAGKSFIQLSSNGTSFDIALSLTGTATLVVNTFYFIELTFDSVAGKYFVYVNGVLDQTVTSSAKINSFASVTLGFANSASSLCYTTGYLDKFEFLPYCDHPNGTAYAVPSAAPNVAAVGYASDWFNTNNYTMNQVSAASTVAGTAPTFAVKQRLYVGEATTGAFAVSSVVSYAYNGQYYRRIPNIQAASTRSLYSNNIGTDLVNATVNIINKTAEFGYIPGNKVPFVTYVGGSIYPGQQIVDRNTSAISTNVGGAYIQSPASAQTTQGAATITNWDTELIVGRTW